VMVRSLWDRGSTLQRFSEDLICSIVGPWHWRKVDASRVERVDATTYTQLIKSLMYLVNTRLDISFEVNQLS